ncbi:hypothetical protein N9165_00385 [Akkermansiaceae bacterium]|nr:hypothetical protein [Akkermansiaceae bacterium]
MYDTTNYILKVEGQDYKLNLARTGGQGSKGDTISNAVIDSNGNLIITVSDSVGTVVNTLNAGSVQAYVAGLNNLPDVEITSVQAQDVLQYDSSTSKFVNHSLTTSNVADIDNTNLTDGALYVYDGTLSKHVATTEINNSNTTIIGGSF